MSDTTPNPALPDAASMAASAIDNAHTRAVITTGRAAGKSDEEIAAELILPMSDEEERQLILILLLNSMASHYGIEMEHNNAILGFSLILNHFPHRPEAQEWVQFAKDVKTTGEVFKFFLEKNALSPATIQRLPGFDPEHFEKQLATPFPSLHALTIRPE